VKRIILHLFFLGFKVEETLKGIFEAAEEAEEKYDKQTKPGIRTGSVCQLEITCLQVSAVQARMSAMPSTALKLNYR
jgi:hypothetical protein